jgi:hypothetical protein
MTDQTRWRIAEVQSSNKQRIHEEQQEMRKEVSDFVLNCSIFHLHKLYEEMKILKKR